MQGIEIIGTGREIPEKVVTNDYFGSYLETDDEWISSRTGIKRRHFCVEEKNYELAAGAAKKAMANAGVTPEEIGVMIVATFSPDYATPSVSCILQKELGLLTNIPVFDINAACAGFLYATRVAGSLLESSPKQYALVIGSEQISTRMNMQDRGSCILFGDGAGAAVIRNRPDKEFYGEWGSDGELEPLNCPGHAMENRYIYMDGKKVFQTAVPTMSNVAKNVLEKANLTLDDIDYVVCHQANERIVRSVMKQLKGPEEKFYMNISEYGNTSAASIPIALDEMNEKGLLKPGMKLLLTGFGAGFTWAGMLMEFGGSVK